MKHDSEFYTLSIGALLHDVGKVGQRAHAHLDGLSDNSLGLESTLCPQAKQGYSTRLHVLYTNEFCGRITNALPSSINASDLSNVASYHHKPATDLDRLVQEADGISAQSERDAGTYLDSSGDFRKVRLNPVVAGISVIGTEDTCLNYEYPIAEYSSKSLFPKKEQATDQSNPYKTIWEDLIKKVSSLSIDNETKFTNSLLSILEYYTWSIPSATNVPIRDISLFDHLRSTSAIAGCLYLAGKKEKQFLLVAGRFGGIQKYITGSRSSSKGFAKSLRGRSFAVAACSDLSAFNILYNLGLPLTHLFMSAGGQFHLLLPNKEDVLGLLKIKEREIHKEIIEKQNGDMRFDLAWKELSADELRTNIPVKLKELNHLLHDKSLKGPSVLRDSNGWRTDSWVLPGYVGTHDELCKSCGLNEATISFGDTNDLICKKCWSDRDTGSRVVRSPYMFCEFDSDSEGQAAFGSFSLRQNLGEVDKQSDVVVSFAEKLPDDPDKPFFRVLRNNYVPTDPDGSVMEFSEIAQHAEGASYLAYLKADVDNLGFIFSNGLITSIRDHQDRASMSRVSTLSRSLEYFFSGYLRSLLKEQFPYIYTVYTGGDDLFLIGPWNQIFDLAITLRSEFSRYTCYNKSWGISAGIALAGSYTPLRHSLSEANRYLEYSKAAINKDSITLLGSRLDWEEYRRFLDQGKQLAYWLEDGTLNSGKVFRLMETGERLKAFVETGITDYLKAIPQLIYDLSRNWGERSNSEREAKKWAQRFCNPEHPDMKLLPMICKYAILRSR